MSKVKIEGNASGTGTLTISAPNTDTDRSLTLPDTAGEVLVTDGTLTIDDTNDRVGIGTSSPTAALDVRRGDTDGKIAEFHQSSGYGFELSSSTSVATITSGYNQDFVFETGSTATERMRIDSSGYLKHDSGFGSVANAYGCRAWVCFDGDGTVSVRESGNVSSITDHGTGDYTANFTNAMPDINYSVGGNTAGTINSDSCGICGHGGGTNHKSTTSLRFTLRYFVNNTLVDRDYVNLQIFR